MILFFICLVCVLCVCVSLEVFNIHSYGLSLFSSKVTLYLAFFILHPKNQRKKFSKHSTLIISKRGMFSVVSNANLWKAAIGQYTIV